MKFSIWPALRSCLQTVLANTSWHFGDGKHINFWTDKWLSHTIIDLLHIPDSLHSYLQARVNDFICDNSWSIPSILVSKFPAVSTEIHQMPITIFPCENQVVWHNSNSGLLTFIDAFFFLKPSNPSISWGKLIWNQFIPPSKSLLVRRLIHHKMPTDENLRVRGYITVSICSLSEMSDETSEHLFFNCTFARYIWSWLINVLQCKPDLSSILSMLSVCNSNWSSQIKHIVLAAIINSIWAIWHCRNKKRFHNIYHWEKCHCHDSCFCFTHWKPFKWVHVSLYDRIHYFKDFFSIWSCLQGSSH